MTKSLDGKKIAFLTANEGVEQVELTTPWEAVEQAGGTPVLVSLQTGQVQCFNHLDKADAVRGRHITSWPSLRTDLTNAGATWVDEEVVVCDMGPSVIVSSRQPDDLPAFCKHLVESFSNA